VGMIVVVRGPAGVIVAVVVTDTVLRGEMGQREKLVPRGGG
jgi:hypothetical protein